MAVYTKQNSGVSREVTTGADVSSFVETGRGASDHVATGFSNRQSKRGAAVSDHTVTLAKVATLNKRGTVTSRVFCSSPKVPREPQGMFNLALGQAAFVQDPDWTVVW